MVSLPDGAEKLCDVFVCFILWRVNFGERLRLKRSGNWTFEYSLLSEIRIPESVEELCDVCFSMCLNLSRVTFRDSSSLKRFGKQLF